VKTALGLMLAAFIGAVGLFVWTAAPCGLWTFASAGETPARCLMGK
jgi:hypothetical protein